MLILSFSQLVTSYAQYAQKYWIFGQNSPAHIQFSYVGPVQTWASPFTVNPSPPPPSVNLGFKGTAIAVEHQTGVIHFYTDGDNVYDGNHFLIMTGLGGNAQSTKPVVLALHPGCSEDTIYVFLNPTGGGGTNAGPLRYRKYAISSRTFSSIFSVPGLYSNTDIGEGLLLVPNSVNGRSFWIICNLKNSNTYVVYKVDDVGVNYHASFQFGSNVGNYKNMTYSAIRNEIAFCSGQGMALYICGFDAVTGMFMTNSYQVLPNQGANIYDVEYSPSGEFLYYVQYSGLPRLWQYQFSTGRNVLLDSLGNNWKGGLKLGPDGFIYHI